MKVLVCDDVAARSARIADRITDAGRSRPHQILEPHLTEELKKLFESIKTFFKDPKTTASLPRLLFEGADIIILDNNLTHLEVTGARLTAESIAGYVRAFSNAVYIISLNKNLDVDFDLRFLVGDYSTRADLALNTDHLANPALWTGSPAKAKDGFLPWYWPRLEEAASRRRKQNEFVTKHLDRPVFESLGFIDDEAISLLSAHAIGALSPSAAPDGVYQDAGPIRKLTFRDVFVAENRSLPVKEEREQLNEAEQGGNLIARGIMARIVAADIDHWFRRDIIGPQEPLVDVPHLLLRMPFLLGVRANDIKKWNESAHAKTPPYGLERKLYDEHLARWKFGHEIWVPHACFWWHKLRVDERLNDLFFGVKEGDWADVVFCEDRSIFLERSPQQGGGPSEFPAEFEGPWTRRYVARIDKYKYAPRSRLAI
jgi:hypothetical protein